MKTTKKEIKKINGAYYARVTEGVAEEPTQAENNFFARVDDRQKGKEFLKPVESRRRYGRF